MAITLAEAKVGMADKDWCLITLSLRALAVPP